MTFYRWLVYVYYIINRKSATVAIILLLCVIYSIICVICKLGFQVILVVYNIGTYHNVKSDRLMVHVFINHEFISEVISSLSGANRLLGHITFHFIEQTLVTSYARPYTKTMAILILVYFLLTQFWSQSCWL